ncbi:uncharacterized protein E0L32_010620 [Thyridium curvatum]|uniref:Uncharacterized protein n=1 Tax=Thyridium curvatum TaxID=1093900 RepID=A0A507AN69_9PEZI|nr:uncharacterized protein E0L32_010620 [Thyridium curvatum]TPX07724.1 hypothetical protein E0L32_010620 [Thyridium curvatum]
MKRSRGPVFRGGAKRPKEVPASPLTLSLPGFKAVITVFLPNGSMINPPPSSIISIPSGTTILSRGEVLKGCADGTIFLSGGGPHRSGGMTISGKWHQAGAVLAKGTHLPKDMGVPSGTKVPKGTLLPAGTCLPEGMTLPSGSRFRAGVALPGGVHVAAVENDEEIKDDDVVKKEEQEEEEQEKKIKIKKDE